jgi:hypothetical protein
MDGPKENKMEKHTRGMTKGKAGQLARNIHPDAHVQFKPEQYPTAPCRVGYFKLGRYIERASGPTWPLALDRAKKRLPKGGRL